MDERAEEVTRAMHLVAGEARTIEGRLSESDWLVGEHVSAADMVVFPGIMLLLRAMEKREARRPALAFPAAGDDVPGDRALDPARRGAARLRAHLSAALARRRAARLSSSRAARGPRGVTRRRYPVN